MPRYIDADALYQKIDAWREKLVLTYGEVDDYVEGVRDVLDIIEDAPTADVVKIVRCKDCKHFSAKQCRCYVDSFFGFEVNPQYFCASAVRKEKTDD